MAYQRKLDKAALIKDIELYPDAYQRERTARFGASKKAIWQALKNVGIRCKKTWRHPKADETSRIRF